MTGGILPGPLDDGRLMTHGDLGPHYFCRICQQQLRVSYRTPYNGALVCLLCDLNYTGPML